MTDTISRRRLLRLLATLPAGLAAGVAWPRRSAGQGARAGGAGGAPSAPAPIRLGLVVPRASAAAEQARLGVEAGLRDGNTFAELFGKSLALFVEEAASAEEASRKGADLVDKGKVAALFGGLDDVAALALREVVARREALFLNIGSRADELRGAACHRRMFHVQPSDAMYVDVLAQWLVRQRKLARCVVLAAGSPRGRALGGAAAGAVAAAGGQVLAEERLAGAGSGAPAAALRRASRAGAQVVFLAMDSEEQLAVARAAREAGLGVPLAGPGLEPGEFLSRDLAGVPGFWSVLWYHEWTRFSARELNRRFLEDFKRPMQGLGWAAWAGVRLLAEAAVRAEEASPAAWGRFLEGEYPFDGHKGEQLTFRPWDHQLRVTFGIVSPRPPDRVGEESDVYDSLADNLPRDLDAVGVREGASRCRFAS